MRTGLGIDVIRPTAAVPQAGWQNIFTVAGQNVVFMILGTRTIAQAAGVNLVRLRETCTVGGVVFLDDGTLFDTNDAAGTLYTITGNPNDPIQSGFVIQGGLQGALIGGYGLIMPAGIIAYYCSAAAGTGSVQWSLWYYPISAGANIVAA